jgi:hypothetical protein
MAKNKNYATIGGNGFGYISEYYVNELVNSSLTQRQLAFKTMQIGRNLNALTRILETMPEEMFNLVGKDIFEAAEKINDLNGAIGTAADRKAGN